MGQHFIATFVIRVELRYGWDYLQIPDPGLSQRVHDGRAEAPPSKSTKQIPPYAGVSVYQPKKLSGDSVEARESQTNQSQRQGADDQPRGWRPEGSASDKGVYRIIDNPRWGRNDRGRGVQLAATTFGCAKGETSRCSNVGRLPT